MFGLLKKFKEGFKKTTQSLWGALVGRKLDPQSIEELEAILYGADLGVETTQTILARAREAYKQQRQSSLIQIAREVVEQELRGAEAPAHWLGEKRPQVIVLVGTNGAGKTTTVAKLAYKLKAEGHRVLLGACDTFRAAANEQIHMWSDRLSLDLIESQSGADAAAVAFDALKAAQARSADALVLDTAGRLHTKTNLLEELAKINRVLQKLDPSAPHHKWLVLDGSLGTNLVSQAKVFHQTLGLTGLIITKLDGTSRGGALVAIYRELRLPIYFVGLGEQPDDLQPFSVENYTSAIFADSGNN